MKEGSKKGQLSEKSEKVAGVIATYLLRIQKGFARFMAARTAGLSKKGLKIWLAIFCASFGGASIVALLGVFASKEKGGDNLKPTPLSFPQYYHQSDRRPLPALSHRDMVKIVRFRKYMDSLANSSSGRKIYDSIQRVRPHLLDSIRTLETFYQSQVK